MCLILFAYRVHPDYPLILAANRDEFYARPALPLGWWQDAPDLLAGRDLAAGGTWAGITRSGRFAAITNYRDPARMRADAPSRGALVGDFLRAAQTAPAYLDDVAAAGLPYNGFNLLAADPDAGLWYYGSRDGRPRAVEAGIHGLSNALLDTPWPKVRRGKAGLQALLEAGVRPDPEALFTLLADTSHPPDAELPSTGVSPEWERLLSPAWIVSPTYGTRGSLVLLWRADGAVQMIEREAGSGEERAFRLRVG